MTICIDHFHMTSWWPYLCTKQWISGRVSVQKTSCRNWTLFTGYKIPFIPKLLTTWLKTIYGIFCLQHFQNYTAASPIRKKVASFCEQRSKHVLLVVGKKPLSTQDWQLENWQLSFKISNYNSFILGQYIFIYLLAFYKEFFLLLF